MSQLNSSLLYLLVLVKRVTTAHVSRDHALDDPQPLDILIL